MIERKIPEGQKYRACSEGELSIRSISILLLLMVQKSGVHQLRLVVFSHYLQGFYTYQVVVWDF